MKIAYADPPYPGQSKKHYEHHADYAGEVDHDELIWRMQSNYDGWVLHTSSTALADVLMRCPTSVRVCAWVKGFAAFKRYVPLAYAWEPVIVKPCRKQVTGGDVVMRDWIQENIVMRKGFSGVKPERVVHWALRCAGAEPTDDVHDLYPGTGSVTRAVETWRSQMVFLVVADAAPDAPQHADEANERQSDNHDHDCEGRADEGEWNHAHDPTDA